MGIEDRPLSDLAVEIMDEWKGWRCTPARPYLLAMTHLEKMTDKYFLDDGEDIVTRFMCNCQTWRGERAREIKKELRRRLKERKEQRKNG